MSDTAAIDPQTNRKSAPQLGAAASRSPSVASKHASSSSSSVSRNMPTSSTLADRRGSDKKFLVETSCLPDRRKSLDLLAKKPRRSSLAILSSREHSSSTSPKNTPQSSRPSSETSRPVSPTVNQGFFSSNAASIQKRSSPASTPKGTTRSFGM